MLNIKQFETLQQLVNISFDNFKAIFLEQLEIDLDSDDCFNYDYRNLEIPSENNKIDLIYTIIQTNDYIFISAGWNNRTSYIIKNYKLEILKKINEFLENVFGYSKTTNSYIENYLKQESQQVLDKNLFIYTIVE